MIKALVGCSLLAAALVGAGPTLAYTVEGKSIGELEADLAAGRTTSVGLVQLYLQRIRTLDPAVHAVIAVNPRAGEAAAASDAARRAGRPLGPLAGVPILLKDNIETADPLPTTAGSLALKANMNGRDAPVVARLRAAGAIVLGKTDLSESANFRSADSLTGTSGVGGQTSNPYALDRSPCGSSAGSGAAAAAEFAAAAIGTETDGSVTCPAAVNGLVGIKPTVGLVSRTWIVPISHSQDTAGPMARSVRDAAVLLAAMAGSDPADRATADADRRKADYPAALRPDALRGARVGVLRFAAGFHPETDRLFEQALAVLKAQGAVLVEIDKFPDGGGKLGDLEEQVLDHEMKSDLNAYLAGLPPGHAAASTLAGLIAFDRAHAAEEMPLFGQDLFETAQATGGVDDPGYVKAQAQAHRLAGPEGIDAMLATRRVSVLVAPTLGPAWLIDPVLKDRFVGGGAGRAPAVAGYPHLTVPMGRVDGLPVGLSFIGPAWSEATLLADGYAYEQASRMAAPPRFAPSAVVESEAAANAVAPKPAPSPKPPPDKQ